jgi:hypothetical protein
MAKSYTYIVSGKWPFPLDMLRYDCAWPAGSEDASTIAMLSGVHRPSLEEVPVNNIHAVTLRSIQHPQIERWRSFSWDVQTVETRR